MTHDSWLLLILVVMQVQHECHRRQLKALFELYQLNQQKGPRG